MPPPVVFMRRRGAGGRMSDAEVLAKVHGAREAALLLQSASDAVRRDALACMAESLADAREAIRLANDADVDQARLDGLAPPLLKRLGLSDDKFALTLAGVRDVAAQADPVGRTLRATELDDGLRLYQTTVPLGVVACVFESRPDAAIQIPALTVRSGNAVLLKGGREATRTNRAIVTALRHGLELAGLPEDAVQLLEGREEVAALLALDAYVDLVVPRGSNAFVRHVMEHTRIPVLGHADGVCHIYVDAQVDRDMATRVIVDAKTDAPATCNAVECVIVHRDQAEFVAPLCAALQAAGVEVRASAAALAFADGFAKVAHAEDFGHEFGDLVVALDLVDSVVDAVAFVNRHGSGHTDAILTTNRDAARAFVAGVDTAGAFVNASTRFADGYRYGLGAELGISTSKIHARGPVGVEGLLSTKWVLSGAGHVAADYQGASPKAFTHKHLDGADAGSEWS